MKKDYWEEIYKTNQQLNLYPWSNVVSFFFSYQEFFLEQNHSILEVGSGSGVNLHPFAKSGLKCIGIDSSKSAVLFAQNLSSQLNLDISFHNFSLNDKSLYDKFQDSRKLFSGVIDRACLSYLSFDEVIIFFNLLKPFLCEECKIFFTPYSTADSSCPDNKSAFVKTKSNSSLEGPRTMFYDEELIYKLVENLSFKIIDITHNKQEKIIDFNKNETSCVSFFEVVMES